MRGLAAFSVLCSHYIKAYDLPCRSAWCYQVLKAPALHFFWDGGSAVCLFFILSGYVLSRRCFDEGATHAFSLLVFMRYVRARLCRILPPYWGILLLSVVVYPWYDSVNTIQALTVPPQDPWIANLWSYSVGWKDALAEANLLHPPDMQVYLPQAWTLSIELLLSLWVPVAAWLASWSSAGFIVMTLLAILWLDVCRFAFHFMLGILYAKYFTPVTQVLSAHAGWRWLAACSGFALYATGDALLSYAGETFAGWIPGVGGLLMLAACGSSERLQVWLAFAPIRYLGRISYSIYLIHFAILIVLTPRFLVWLDADPAYHAHAWWAGLMFTVFCAVLLADLNYRWVEMPAMSACRDYRRKSLE